MVDLLTEPTLVEKAWEYFRNVQTKDRKYQSLLSPEDRPPIWLNRKIMAEYRDQMRKFYYDPSRFDTYLEQLGIQYPTIRSGPAAGASSAPAEKTSNGR
jgi:aminobenzoyl-glutamate utilization protein B